MRAEPDPSRRHPALLTRAADAMRARPLLAIAVASALLAAGAARRAVRVRHRPAPVVAEAAIEEAPPLVLPEGAPCVLAEAARVAGRVTALLVASDGALHAGTSDGGVIRIAPFPGGEAVALALDGREREVNALAEHEGLLWAATQGGVVAFDGERRVLSLLPDDAVTALASAGDALYAGTARGVFRLSAEDGADRVDATGPSGEPLHVTALAASGERLWIGTPSGAYDLPLAMVEAPLLARTARWHPLVAGDPPARTNEVTALAPLGGGVVAGTDDGGLVRVTGGGEAAATLLADPRANAVAPGAAAACGDGVLVGAGGGGLLRALARAKGLAVERVGSGEITAVHAAAGAVVVGRADGAILAGTCPGAAPGSG